ncbi:hypothetical protein [uncultured Methanobrevibacter sp.]|uniref:hypothetical protein n=1 Tax=uncultured Methanobrevibacter sp. TaxID=253161 RepID=UPI0025E4FC4F|nr:hypothetical protein [uncultured Methanobrevibacter sp.]
MTERLEKDFPRVIIHEKPAHHDYSNELDNIFKKLANDTPEELLELRKQQIQNHSNSGQVVYAFNGLVNLIGQKDTEYNWLLMKQFHEELIQLHSPVYLNVPVNTEPLHKWETWSIGELYEKYWDLAISKGWEDYYGYSDLSLKNVFDNVKNYHVVDMLNDLVVNDHIICGYELRSFMNCDSDNRLLEPVNHHYSDKIIEVKLKEKFTSMTEYHNSILNRGE